MTIEQITHLSRGELEARARRGRKHYPDSEHTERVRCLDSFDLLIDTRDKSLSPGIRATGLWESWVTLAIARAIKPGAVCVDVGAHIGYFARIMQLLAQASGYVLAIEPHPEQAELCCRNLAWNGAWALSHIVQKAAWDKSGEQLILSTPGTLTGSASVVGHGPPPDGEAVTKHSVETITIDDQLEEDEITRPVQFIKIDAEGSELNIWRGMSETWKRSPELVVCAECAPTPEGRAFLDAVRSDGARTRVVDYSGEVSELRQNDLAELRMLWISK